MRAVIAPEPGGVEALRLVELPDPRPGPADLLVRVHGAGVNRADVLQRRGRYPPPPGAPDVLGLECAGEIVGVGGDVRGWSVGQPVCAVLPGGGYAELVVVPAAVALPVPPGVDLVAAGGVPEVFATAYDNLFVRARLTAGETVLLHGGASGVGTAAVQLARRAGCRVLVTAGSPQRVQACLDLGADDGIVYREEDFVARTRALTGGRGADVILDVVGGPYLDRNLRALAVEGRLAVIGLQGEGGGSSAPAATAELNLARLLSQRLTVLASTLRARTTGERVPLMRRLSDEVWPGFADGTLRPVIDRVLPLEEVAAAHAAMEAGGHVGKIVLACSRRVP